MSSLAGIYNVPSSLNQLRASDPTISISWRKVIPRANATGSSFPNSTISFGFNVGGNQKWLPSHSYVVIRNKIYENENDFAVQPFQNNTMGAGQVTEQKVAPSWLQPQCLFDSANVQIGGYTVSSIQQSLPQLAAYSYRMSKSHAWSESYAPSVQCGRPNFNERAAQINLNGSYFDHQAQPPSFTRLPNVATTQADGTITGAAGSLFLTELRVGDRVRCGTGNQGTIASITSNIIANYFQTGNNIVVAGGAVDVLSPNVTEQKTDQANLYETAFQPPLSIFSQNKALAGDWMLNLNPKSNLGFRQSALQSVDSASVTGLAVKSTPTARGDALVEDASYDIDDIYFMCCVVESATPNASEENIVLDLEELSCQPRRIAGGPSVTESFQVPRSTYATAFALQSSEAGNNTLVPPTLFKGGNPAVATAFNKEQDGLTKWQFQYAGQSRNSPETERQVTPGVRGASDGITYTANNWLQSAMASGGAFDPAGPLSSEFESAQGPMVAVKWHKPSGVVATDLTLRASYGAFDGGLQHNVLLMVASRQICQYTLKNNIVSTFSNQEA